MGNRLSKIVTRTGDDGTTGLTGGARLKKTDARVVAMGDVDELNSQIGVLLAAGVPAGLEKVLLRIQHELFDLGGELSMPGEALVSEAHVLGLERDVETLNAALPPLKEFVLPGGTPPAAAAHLARAVCRRAERAVWALHAQSPVNAATPRYLNRLSDLLFVAARALARVRGGREALWAGPRTGRVRRR